MTVLQHYYTSFVNRETGRAGFQVKAMSRGISAETQAMIARLIAYRIPNNAEERDIKNHPVALRYFYQNPQKCILLCTQSSGEDESGRPGNFFAHSVVMSPDDLANQPPILYWHSPFWRKQAAETTIVPLPEFDAEPSLDIIDEMWAFLADESRREAFYKLMCAVVQSERTRRRIIIIDSDKNVALWVAAVSCMLPPSYRFLLSFATYHHDPYQSWFLITGTTDDSTFRSVSEESVSHFVLDGRTNRTSNVEESQYARLVRDNANPARYEKYMLRFFLWHEQRFPKPTCIDERLELFATYIKLREQKGSVYPSNVLPAVNIVLSTFEELPQYGNEDRQELAQLKDALEHMRQKSRNPDIQKTYDRVVHLYQKHNIPTDELFKDDLKYRTEVLLEDAPRGVPRDAVALFKQLRQTYNDHLLIKYVNQQDYLEYVADFITGTFNLELQLIWKHIGPYLRPDSPSQKLFLRSLRVWETLLQNKSPAEANELFSLMKNAFGGKELEWLELLVNSTKSPPDVVVEHFYWQLVSTFSLEQREPYRAVVQQAAPTIADFEFRKELSATGLQSKIQVIFRWVTYTRHSAIKSPGSIVNEGLDSLKHQCNNRQWRDLILDVLVNADLLPLLGQREDTLVQEAFSELTLQRFSREHVELYKRYKDHPALTVKGKNILAGMLAMANARLDVSVARRLYEYVSELTSPEVYSGEIDHFMTIFLDADVTEEDHLLMMGALFVWKYEERFWLSYWKKVHVMLTRLLTYDLERAIRLFSYWFAFLPGKVARLDQCYVAHQFFLGLQQHMYNGQNLPDYSKAIANLAGKASSYPWYPLIQEMFQVRRQGFVEKGQEWVKSVHKRLSTQKVNEQAQEAEHKFSSEIGLLLVKGAAREQHIQNMATLYSGSSHEAFWAVYKEHLIQILIAADIDLVLEVFSFWFDESFNYLGREPYIAQGFFIRLPQIFETARKEHENDFYKTAELVISRCSQPASRGEGYLWYVLIHPFFLEALSTRRKSK